MSGPGERAPTRQLDYEPRREGGAGWVHRRLVVDTCCFGASWLGWFIVAVATYDPIEDDLFSWVIFLTVVLGTICGAALWMVARLGLYLWSRLN